MKKLILILVILFTVASCTPDAIETNKVDNNKVVSDIDKGDVRPPGSQH
jgi:hypothetical protein